MILMLRNLPSKGTPRFSSLREILDADLAPHFKVPMLAEQLLFAKYLYTLEPKNTEYISFKDKIISAVFELGRTVTIGEDKFESQITTLKNISNSFTGESYWSQIIPILQDPGRMNKFDQLSPHFYLPFLHDLCNCNINDKTTSEGNTFFGQSSYVNAQLLLPTVYNDKGSLYFTFEIETFPTFVVGQKPSDLNLTLHDDDGNKIFSYLTRFNWSGKTMEEAVGMCTRLVTDFGSNSDENNSLLAMFDGVSNIGLNKIQYNDMAVHQSLLFLKNIANIYSITVNDMRDVGQLISTFGTFPEEATSYLETNRPTYGQVKAYECIGSLQFLNEHLADISYGIEEGESAEGGEDDFEVEEEPAGDDTGGDDDTSDDSDFGDDTGDDTGDDSEGEDDSTDDSTDEGSDDDLGDGEIDTETDTQIEDPTTIVYKIDVENPSTSTILYRKRVEKALSRYIQHPPENVSSKSVDRIKRFMLSWLYIVSASVTKRFLTLHLSNNNNLLNM